MRRAEVGGITLLVVLASLLGAFGQVQAQLLDDPLGELSDGDTDDGNETEGNETDGNNTVDTTQSTTTTASDESQETASDTKARVQKTGSGAQANASQESEAIDAGIDLGIEADPPVSKMNSDRSGGATPDWVLDVTGFTTTQDSALPTPDAPAGLAGPTSVSTADVSIEASPCGSWHWTNEGVWTWTHWPAQQGAAESSWEVRACYEGGDQDLHAWSAHMPPWPTAANEPVQGKPALAYSPAMFTCDDDGASVNGSWGVGVTGGEGGWLGVQGSAQGAAALIGADCQLMEKTNGVFTGRMTILYELKDQGTAVYFQGRVQI